ncbi:MAG: hypothetical protein ACREIT_11730, partial [Tepidisphaeraceae bacterium]
VSGNDGADTARQSAGADSFSSSTEGLVADTFFPPDRFVPVSDLAFGSPTLNVTTEDSRTIVTALFNSDTDHQISFGLRNKRDGGKVYFGYATVEQVVRSGGGSPTPTSVEHRFNLGKLKSGKTFTFNLIGPFGTLASTTFVAA